MTQIRINWMREWLADYWAPFYIRSKGTSDGLIGEWQSRAVELGNVTEYEELAIKLTARAIEGAMTTNDKNRRFVLAALISAVTDAEDAARLLKKPLRTVQRWRLYGEGLLQARVHREAEKVSGPG